MTKLIIAVVALVALNLGTVSCRSTGPPNVQPVCETVRPAAIPNSPHEQQDGSGTYNITTNIPVSSNRSYFAYSNSTQYTVTITAGTNILIRGFLMQAWDPSDTRIGYFTPRTGQRWVNCSDFSINAEATIGHSMPNTNPTVTLTWTSPPDTGMVDFRFTIVRSRTMYFGPLSAATLLQTPTTAATTAGAKATSASFLLGTMVAATAMFLKA